MGLVLDILDLMYLHKVQKKKNQTRKPFTYGSGNIFARALYWRLIGGSCDHRRG